MAQTGNSRKGAPAETPAAKPLKAKSKNSRRRRAALIDGSSDYLARRSEIIHVAAGLFKDKGFNRTSFNDIASYSGIERAALYYYFGSKEELFREACKGTFDRNIADIETINSIPSISAADKLAMLMERLMIYFDECYPYCYIYLQERVNTIASDEDPWAQEMIASTKRVEAAYKALIGEAIKAGQLRQDVPIALAANAIFGMLNWTHQWYEPDGKYDANSISVAFRRIFFEGMIPRTPASSD